jgi:NAD-dependent deacetylase
MNPQIVVLSGAGISADSGLATFRDAGGLWEGHRPEEVATPEAWAADPEMVWRFYQMRRASLKEVEPNPGHLAVAELQRRAKRADTPFVLITQNVDDLHERGGSTELLHMHGELAKLRCEACGAVVRNSEDLDPDRFLPCETCSHDRLRPDIVWFGEMPYHLERIEEVMRDCTHFLSLGTSGVVYPAAGLLAAARSRGAATWVNSLDPPENLSPEDRFFPGRGAEILPGLVEELCAEVGL